MSDRIPSELITDILSRLAVKPLLRFRTVSKQWRLLIDSKEFHKRHLSRSIETKSNSSIIAIDNNREVYSIDFDAPDKAHKINFLYGKWHIFDSCNGIVLLYGGENFGDKKIALFNPATRSLYFLPDDNAPHFTGFYTKSSQESFALGYDSVSNDFKVVSIHELGSVRETRVFSLKTNSWKKIHDFPYELKETNTWGVHFSGALHTIVNQCPDRKGPESIIALDLALENYRMMELPDISTEGVKFILNKLGQCLSLCACTKMKAVIWVMKEYGVAQSWTKLLSVEPPTSTQIIPLKILGYSKDGEKVLLHYPLRRFTWYDLQTEQFNSVDMSNSDLYAHFNVEVCIESLFQLDGSEKTKNGTDQAGPNIDVVISAPRRSCRESKRPARFEDYV